MDCATRFFINELLVRVCPITTIVCPKNLWNVFLAHLLPSLICLGELQASFDNEPFHHLKPTMLEYALMRHLLICLTALIMNGRGVFQPTMVFAPIGNTNCVVELSFIEGGTYAFNYITRGISGRLRFNLQMVSQFTDVLTLAELSDSPLAPHVARALSIRQASRQLQTSPRAVIKPTSSVQLVLPPP